MVRSNVSLSYPQQGLLFLFIFLFEDRSASTRVRKDDRCGGVVIIGESFSVLLPGID